MNTNTQAITINLNDLTGLHVTGDDAAKFLHAQFTNDLANLAINSWQYSGYCTPKGRLLAFMTIARLDQNEFLLILPVEVAEKVLPRLRMFVMRDDVAITEQDEDSSIIGILHADAGFSGIEITREKENGKLGRNGNNYLLTIDHESGRYLYIGDTGSLDTDTSKNRNNWTLADIQSGIPAITLATQEAYVPQMVNLDIIGAVNFKKGCYPGQEIVARVHYLGKIKQRMYVLETSSKESAKPGDQIFTSEQPDKAAGTVVQAAISESNQYVQAVLQTKAVDEDPDLRLNTAEGVKLTLTIQPYSVSMSEKTK